MRHNELIIHRDEVLVGVLLEYTSVARIVFASH